MANAEVHVPAQCANPHEAYMEQAIGLALCGRGWVNPNPMVGCVIVSDGRVIGKGYHTRFGNLHAEREALADCARRGNSAEGACAYVTLEPCSHYGKTPPCADALVEAGVSKVVIGSADPNPQVAGQGAARLRQAGIEVVEGVLQTQCDALNRPFFKYIRTGIPYVVAKYAMTVDGKVATRTGESKWISGKEARSHAHLQRATYAAIMVGVGTVIADDPMLSCRIEVQSGDAACHQPVRVICDSHLRTPLGSKVVATAKEQPTLIATCVDDASLDEPYEAAGCTVVHVPQDGSGRVDMAELLRLLGERQLDSVYTEGGSGIFGCLFDGGFADEMQVYIAPKVFGGTAAPGPVGGLGVEHPDDAHLFHIDEVSRLGEDLFVRLLSEQNGLDI